MMSWHYKRVRYCTKAGSRICGIRSGNRFHPIDFRL